VNASRGIPLLIASLVLMVSTVGLGGCGFDRRSGRYSSGMEAAQATSTPSPVLPTRPSLAPQPTATESVIDPPFNQLDALLGSLESDLNSADTLQDDPELR
jgi:hypothetical protein